MMPGGEQVDGNVSRIRGGVENEEGSCCIESVMVNDGAMSM